MVSSHVACDKYRKHDNGRKQEAPTNCTNDRGHIVGRHRLCLEAEEGCCLTTEESKPPSQESNEDEGRGKYGSSAAQKRECEVGTKNNRGQHSIWTHGHCLTNQANRRDEGRREAPPRSVRVEREVRARWALHGSRSRYLHHCFSQGMPSLLPSIFVPGQFCRKYVASAQDVICEQYFRPSHLNRPSGADCAVAGASSVRGMCVRR